MFIGHYAVGFALKKKADEIPLWLLYISVQLVDILAFSFVLLGVERIAYNPTDNPFLRTIIEYVPYSHSLFANLLLAALVFLIFQKIRGRKWGIILGGGVLSHWFIDTLVHKGDMPLFHNSFKVGLGLWQYPWLAFLFELVIFGLAGYYLLKNYQKLKRYLVLIFLMGAGFAAMFFAPEAEGTPVQVAISNLLLYAIFTALACWCERRR
ncbi:MAG: hypothetical protein ABFQ82_05775 [Thermodesulfobacteriota bacterium]